MSLSYIPVVVERCMGFSNNVFLAFILACWTLWSWFKPWAPKSMSHSVFGVDLCSAEQEKKLASPCFVFPKYFKYLKSGLSFSNSTWQRGTPMSRVYHHFWIVSHVSDVAQTLEDWQNWGVDFRHTEFWQYGKEPHGFTTSPLQMLVTERWNCSFSCLTNTGIGKGNKCIPALILVCHTSYHQGSWGGE